MRKRLNATPDAALAVGVAAASEEGPMRNGDRLDIQISEQPVSALAAYGRIPITFEVRWVLDVEVHTDGLGGITLLERQLPVPYTKDYDATDGGGPLHWPQRFDLSRWGLLMAHHTDQCVGGAAVVCNAAGLHMLEGRDDLAVLWDIRVQPEVRGRGVGAALFQAAEAWARTRGCEQLKVETQNINVPACRFYARQGCVLGTIHRFAYPDCPEEVQLLWYKDLCKDTPSG
ncbi:MAG: GNAT family N-acetyltransferase [bacterium]